jgi:cell division protein FtsI (penicillin-binding protein 3)
VLRDDTSATVRSMLRSVVSGGTGRNADTHLYPVGGKTGTALKRKVGGGNSTNKRISSFVGTFPIQNPRYVVFIMVDEPQEREVTGRYATGGKVAAPAVSRIVDRIAPMLGVQPQPETPDTDDGTNRNRGLQTAAVRH